jgi:hypothetical protein
MARNSTSFVKGDPRINRKGRTKVGESLAEKFRDAMAEKLNGDYSKLDSLIDTIVTKALKGNLQAIDFVLARGWGKMIERIETNNTNKNYDFSGKSLEERMKMLEFINSVGTTVPSDNPDTE